MSLKAIHILFIIACIALAAFVGAWSFLSPAAKGSGGFLTMGILFSATAVGLVVYLVAFLKKLRTLRALSD